jgi:hypothetical protein
MQTSTDTDDPRQPVDPKLTMAIEAAFRNVSLTDVVFVPAPRVWQKSNPAGSSKGPKGARKAQIKMDLAKRDGFQCAYCTREFVDLDDATLDHVIPNCVVGHWQTWNLLLACGPCNSQKSDGVPLVLLPLVCGLLRDLMPLAQKKLRVQQSRDDRRACQRKQRIERQRAAQEAATRQALVREQLEALSGTPVRLALEAAPQRAALLPGTGGE